MIELIYAYYKTWETKNLDMLERLLHRDFYGIRNLYEDLFFCFDEMKERFSDIDIKSFKINSYTYNNDLYNIELTINEKPVLAKITIKDKRIYKVYEIIKTDKRRFKCICAYDGSCFNGYQKQNNVETIQGTIESALSTIFKEEITIHSSGRTDKGVHARNQTFHFDIESSIQPDNVKKVLNSYLPNSIYIKQVEEVDLTFHSRYDVKVKTYQYIISLKEFDPMRRHMEWVQSDLNIDTLQKELTSIIGTHDFTSFTKTTNQNTVRTIYEATVEVADDLIYITISGNGFLRYMVRNIIGALISINKGKLQYSIKELLEQKDVSLIKDIAPANGLYLYDVKY